LLTYTTQVNNKNEKGTGFAVLGFLMSLIALAYFAYQVIVYQQALSRIFG